jgi:hypothetical protein
MACVHISFGIDEGLDYEGTYSLNGRCMSHINLRPTEQDMLSPRVARSINCD